MSRGVPVLLDDGDSIGISGFFDGDGGLLCDFVDVSDEVVGDFINGFVVLFWDNKSMPRVQRSNVEKHEDFVVLPDDAGRRLSLHNTAENTRCIAQEVFSPCSHLPSELLAFM